ncbi:MAG: putative oxidoreductase [Chloroflexi bacterium]|nr:putative oxidoreductase [Chloroflexota bacterium]
MVGGGPGANIGESHRMGMRLDDRYSLLAGVFSRDQERSRAFGHALGIAPDRLYPDYRAMAEAEAQRPDGIEAVSIVTTNETHHPIARAFLEKGIAVICDKPLTVRLDDALDLYRLARDTGAIFALTHNYSAYAMVRQAARMVRDNSLGTVRVVQVEHASGWASEPLEQQGHKQALWRTDPAIGGEASVVYDLGTHAHQLLRYVTGLEVTELSAEMSTLVPGRRVYDNAQVALRLSNGARGSLWACMAATGQEHGLRIRVFGETASLDWRHEEPHHLAVRYLDGSTRILAQGGNGLATDAQRVTRVGLGHPEGFIESMANLYTDVAEALLRRRAGQPDAVEDLGYPTARDGVIGIRFVEAVAASHAGSGRWTDASIDI